MIECPKCAAVSGDDWSQCKGGCPMPGSPSFDDSVAKLYAESPDDVPFAPPEAYVS